MASTEAYSGIKAEIQSALAPLSVLDFDQIEPAILQGTDAFIALEEVVENETLAAFGGQHCHREQGVLVAHALTPSPESSASARALAQSIQALLRSRTLTGGIRIFEVDPPAPGSSNNGLWTVYSVAVSYELDTVRALP